ncbi:MULTISPECIES: methyltransferase domain-containing protein [unclassified Micromonospora]|uniref:methyltransferase domain-containing protein n=1 Tax=unclassified Micromonospora TaxID=2617518 RepID=UPI00363FC6FA
MTTLLIRELTTAGIQHGQRVLDIGAGAGTLTDHLARFVGPHGRVVAVNTDTDQLRPTSIIDVYRRDIRTDPLPGDPGTYDVVIARCLDQQHAHRPDTIEQMITLLKPGGWLVLGELTYAPTVVYREPEAENASALITIVADAVLAALINNDHLMNWGTWAPATLLRYGMEHICVFDHAETWTGGGPGTMFLADHARRLHDVLLQAGLPADDLHRFLDLITDPALVMRSFPTGTLHARKPQ